MKHHPGLMAGAVFEAAVRKTAMIVVIRHLPSVRASLRTYLKAHRTATSLRSKKGGLTTRAAV